MYNFKYGNEIKNNKSDKQWQIAVGKRMFYTKFSQSKGEQQQHSYAKYMTMG